VPGYDPLRDAVRRLVVVWDGLSEEQKDQLPQTLFHALVWLAMLYNEIQRRAE
jgi:hypothetical protein